MRKFPELPDFEKPRNLRPSNCQGCGALLCGVGGMTYMHGKWLCINCTDRERKGAPAEMPPLRAGRNRKCLIFNAPRPNT